MAAAKSTIDHETIRRWAEQRQGAPARVRDTNSQNEDGSGVLRIAFESFDEQTTLEPLSWEDWFRAFDENNLAFLYQDDEQSRFVKLVDRNALQPNNNTVSFPKARQRRRRT